MLWLGIDSVVEYAAIKYCCSNRTPREFEMRICDRKNCAFSNPQRLFREGFPTACFSKALLNQVHNIARWDRGTQITMGANNTKVLLRDKDSNGRIDKTLSKRSQGLSNTQSLSAPSLSMYIKLS